jgi:hypothetical protein
MAAGGNRRNPDSKAANGKAELSKADKAQQLHHTMHEEQHIRMSRTEDTTERMCQQKRQQQNSYKGHLEGIQTSKSQGSQESWRYR